MKTILRNKSEKYARKGMLLPPPLFKPDLVNNLKAWILILPSFVFLTLFTLYPICATLYNSFFQINLSSRTPDFIGLENFKALIHDTVFIKAAINNLIIALVTIPISIVIALSMAVFSNTEIRAKGLVRAGYFYPTLLPMIAVANIWLFIYTPQYGLLSYFEKLMGLEQINWLGQPSRALPAVIVVMIWKEAGYFMIFFLSGLQNIPKDMYGAAKIDGANSWQVFRNITWPMLMPTTLFVLIIALTNAFKTVDHLYIMTKGGPDNSSNMILYYIYQVGFEFWDIGMASTITSVLVTILLAITCLKFFSIDKRTNYD